MIVLLDNPFPSLVWKYGAAHGGQEGVYWDHAAACGQWGRRELCRPCRDDCIHVVWVEWKHCGDGSVVASSDSVSRCAERSKSFE